MKIEREYVQIKSQRLWVSFSFFPFAKPSEVSRETQVFFVSIIKYQCAFGSHNSFVENSIKVLLRVITGNKGLCLGFDSTLPHKNFFGGDSSTIRVTLIYLSNGGKINRWSGLSNYDGPWLKKHFFFQKVCLFFGRNNLFLEGILFFGRCNIFWGGIIFFFWEK